ncbi:MAG: superfamily II RNA helicase, partial [Planctomycetota bacterium]
ARSVVFTSLRKFDGVTFDYLRTRDYMQMAGRAGRQGIDTMGLVVSFLDERDVQEAPVERLVSGKPEPVESRFRLSYATILHLIEHLGRERLIEAWEKSFNQFQHRGKSRKARESNRAVQRSLVDAHLNLLRELNYLDDEAKLTARGRVGRLFYGYELQVTELLFQGVLEDLPANLIAQVFVGLVHSARRREQVRIPQRFFGDLREDIDKMIRKLMRQEAEAGLTNPLKEADWGLAPAIDRWLGGAELEDLEDDFEGTSGDMVRTMRQSLQLMRQVRRTLDPRDNLYDRMADAIQGLNREEVDAQRQLELG